ncbi:MAG TPA: hypothetical protein VEV84_12880 [Pyrinomonadaceae bacterium]|nr:hypothetical protein [Pyrinomonadaceae bacterium]
MRFLDVFVNEGVLCAEIALRQASSESVVDECRNYLSHLAGYRQDLRALRCLSDDSLYARSPLSGELISQARSAVRSVIEITIRETNRTEKLLEFFTAINVHQAAAILNTCKYLGSADWEGSSSGVRFTNGFESEQLGVDKAVKTASRLRREAYVVINQKQKAVSAFAAEARAIS